MPATPLAARLPKLCMPANTPKAEPRSSVGTTDATAAFCEVSTQPMATPERRSAPTREEGRGASEILGIDPLYIACEGRLVIARAAEDGVRWDPDRSTCWW